MLTISIIVSVLFLCLSQIQADDLVVSLNQPKSQIRGHILKSHQGKDYYGFQDIPYAAPPVGENRFAEPKPHPAWSGVLNTTQNSKVCMQFGFGNTEDCLVLNVYTPVRSSTAKLPVYVWIHGGAFMAGSGTYQSSNPQNFIDYDIVVVAINYRVGAFGFLTTEDGVIPGNLGLKDQLLALKWVNQNIAVFGGDPTKVTIAGQSAGSISVGYHIVSQKSKGLFRGAIMESGTALVHGSYIAHAKNYAFQLGKLLDKSFSSTDSKELLKVLRKASASDILSAAQRVQKIGNQVGILTDLIWAVVIENSSHQNAYITAPMHASLKNGQFEQLPIMIGYTSEEMITFMGSADGVRNNAAGHDKSPANLISYKFNIDEKNAPVAGEKIKKLYTSTTFVQNLASFVGYSSDIGFVNAIVRQADLSSKHVPVYLYEFSYKGSNHHDPTNIPNLQGVGHGEELGYMWGFNARAGVDAQTSNRLLSMWTNFIKNLNPTPAANSSLGIPIWPKLQSTNVTYMDIGSSLVVKTNPKKYVGIRSIFEQYLQAPFNVF